MKRKKSSSFYLSEICNTYVENSNDKHQPSLVRTKKTSSEARPKLKIKSGGIREIENVPKIETTEKAAESDFPFMLLQKLAPEK